MTEELVSSPETLDQEDGEVADHTSIWKVTTLRNKLNKSGKKQVGRLVAENQKRS